MRCRGCLTVAILGIYYAAPLSVMLGVLRTRDSSTLLLPLAIMNTVNGTLWTAYGFAISDYFIMAPNAFGALCGVVQILLCFIFPKKEKTSPAPSDAMDGAIDKSHIQMREQI